MPSHFMRINARNKGKRGEREFRDVLRAAGYCKARRGQQFSGEQGNPDVVCPELPGIHWEVKRCQVTKIHDWMKQAEMDAWQTADLDALVGCVKAPVVAHKRNGERWLATLNLNDLLEIIRRSDLPQSPKEDTND